MKDTRRRSGAELFELNRTVPVSDALLRAVRGYPQFRTVEHCGALFDVPVFDIDATCPTCGLKIKLRSFAATTEIEDVFDAVFEWLLEPGAEEVRRRRQHDIKADR